MTADDELDLRPATAEDAPAMLRVFRAAFGTWPALPLSVDPIEHVRWKLASHPRAAPANIVLFEDGELVGASFQIGRDVSVRGDLKFAGSGADVALDPRFQGRRFMSKGMGYWQRSVFGLFDLSFNTPSNHPRMRAFSAGQEQSPHLPNPLRLLVHASGARALISTQLRAGGLRGALGFAARAARRRGAPADSVTGLEVVTIDRFDRRADDLWSLARDEFEFIGDRTAAYLNWRHRDPRGGDSLVRAIIEDERLVGYAVIRWTGEAATLADLLVAPGREDVLNLLLSDALKQAHAFVDRVRCALLDGHPYLPALRTAGFVNEQEATVVSYRGHPDHEDDLAFLADPDARVHITFGDFDYV